MAVDLLSVKITAKSEVMPALGPSYGISDDSGGAGVVSLKRIAQAGFAMTGRVAK